MPKKIKSVFIKTFGCVHNQADSEKIKAYFWNKGYIFAENWKKADLIVINSCVVRESAENRVYGLVTNIKNNNRKIKIIVTGCLTGVFFKRDKLNQLKKRIPEVDEWWPIEKFQLNINPLRQDKETALIPISNGCNNFCSYCIVPMARGREISRDYDEIIKEVDSVIEKGFQKVILIGQNVNSYGADFDKAKTVSMGKYRFRSMFPKLLQEIALKNIKIISFVSSNPWDFSDDLIEVIAKHPNIDRLIHLPFQSGDDGILKKMNRGYTQKEYLTLIRKIKRKIKGVRLSTDIIVGFPGENEKAFANTIKVCKKVGFEIAYINKYSPRKGTVSASNYLDDVPQRVKRQRWKILNDLINKRII